MVSQPFYSRLFFDFIISKKITPLGSILLSPELLLNEVIEPLFLDVGLVVVFEQVLDLPLLILFPGGIARMDLAVHIGQPDVQFLPHIDHINCMISWDHRLLYWLLQRWKIINLFYLFWFLDHIRVCIVYFFLSLLWKPAVFNLLLFVLNHFLFGLLNPYGKWFVFVAIWRLVWRLLGQLGLILWLCFQTIVYGVCR